MKNSNKSNEIYKKYFKYHYFSQTDFELLSVIVVRQWMFQECHCLCPLLSLIYYGVVLALLPSLEISASVLSPFVSLTHVTVFLPSSIDHILERSSRLLEVASKLRIFLVVECRARKDHMRHLKKFKQNSVANKEKLPKFFI